MGTPKLSKTRSCAPWCSWRIQGKLGGATARAKNSKRGWGDPQSRADRSGMENCAGPRGDWIPAVLQAAHTRLLQLRQHTPDAGGLVIATDKNTARAYARILESISSTPVTVVLSDEVGASDRIKDFSDSMDEWMVAVRMVSEGVDVPRLAVGVYATSSSTPLFLRRPLGVLSEVAALASQLQCSYRACRCCWTWRRRWKDSVTTF